MTVRNTSSKEDSQLDIAADKLISPPKSQVIGVAIAAAVVNITLSLWLYKAGAFLDYNRLFETDPNVRLGDIAHGWSSGGDLHWMLPRSLHPLLPYLFSLPIRGLALILREIGVESSEVIIREHLGLLIVPFANAISAGCLCLVAAIIGLKRWRLTFFNVLTVLTFSNTVFGSVPDHFALTRTASLLLLLCLAWEVHRPGRGFIRRGAWPLLSVIAAGITATNAIFVASTRLVLELANGRRVAASARLALSYSLGGMVVAVAVGVCLGVLRYGAPVAPAPSQLGKWFTLPTLERISAVLGAVGESFVPLELVDVAIRFKDRVWPTIVMASTLEVHANSVLIGLGMLLLTVWGAIRMSRLGRAASAVAWASALQFGGIAMFLVWGDIPFLYSPHWLGGQEILLGALLLQTGRSDDRVALFAAVALFCASAVATPIAWKFIIHAVQHPVAPP